MDLLVTLAVVAVAAAFLARRAWRTFVPRAGAGVGCGCAGAKAGCPATSDAVRRMQEAVRGLNRG
jgi:hypothetical protein